MGVSVLRAGAGAPPCGSPGQLTPRFGAQAEYPGSGSIIQDLVRKSAPKPIRVYLQDGLYDNRLAADPTRDWYLQSAALAEALREKRYDITYVLGGGGHSDDHGGAILPDILRWLWRGYPKG